MHSIPFHMQREKTGAGCRGVLYRNRSLFPAWMLFVLSLIHSVVFGIAGFLFLLAFLGAWEMPEKLELIILAKLFWFILGMVVSCVFFYSLVMMNVSVL